MTERWRESLSELDTVEPSPDVWARAVAQSAEASSSNLPGVGRGRILAAVVAIAVATGGVLVAFLSLRELRTAPEKPGVSQETDGFVTYLDPTGAWEISYPERFAQGRLPNPFHGRFTTEGIWIGNWDSPTFSPETGGPILSEFPNDGVVVFISQTFGGPSRIPVDPDTSLPISFEDLRLIPGPQPGIHREGTVIANGATYLVVVRASPDGRKEDLDAAKDILSSLRFLPLEEGTIIGGDATFYVLGTREGFPVDSVTRFDASNLPRAQDTDPSSFYLVHVPEGFYALAWPDNLMGGYQDCEVTYDAAAQEFSCPNGARWALDGTVIAKPDPEMRDDPLHVLLVRISLDGHVLVSPNVSSSDTELDLQLTGG